MKEKLMAFQLIIDKDLLKAFKLKCVNDSISMSQKIRDMIVDYIGG